MPAVRGRAFLSCLQKGHDSPLVGDVYVFDGGRLMCDRDGVAGRDETLVNNTGHLLLRFVFYSSSSLPRVPL